MRRPGPASFAAGSTTAELLADIGAIDANLMSLPMDDLDRMHFYVVERERLLERLRAKSGGSGRHLALPPEAMEGLGASTQEIRGRLCGVREKILESLQLADAQLRQIEGFRRPGEALAGRLANRWA
jgi:hypothetical protein